MADLNSVLRIAVVGHTNTGKTSLMRTLTRDATFGEVSNRPAVTRHVEGAQLLVDGEPVVELFDTPGLEDSIGLLDVIESFDVGDSRIPLDRIEAFLRSEEAATRFSQESKAIRQVLHSDVALYVIDARDRVLPRLLDELDILSRLARPIIPVLNFVANDGANVVEWRTHLSKLNLHAVAEFDTVVFDLTDEARLFEKVKVLLGSAEAPIDALIRDRKEARQGLVRASAALIAELVIDVASFGQRVERRDSDDASANAPEAAAFRDKIRARESQCVRLLLDLHRFRPEDCAGEQLPLVEEQWDTDLFNAALLRDAGVKASGPAAAGAMAGLTLDVMFAGLSLGAATATGAAIGAAIGFTRTHGRRFVDRVRGWSLLRCDDGALRVLMHRQIWLVQQLLRRGHASQGAVDFGQFNSVLDSDDGAAIRTMIDKTRVNLTWSGIDHDASSFPASRNRVAEQLTAALTNQILSPASS